MNTINSDIESVDLDSLGSPPPGETVNAVGGDGIHPSSGEDDYLDLGGEVEILLNEIGSYSITELKAMAKVRKVKGRYKMKKKQLIAALQKEVAK